MRRKYTLILMAVALAFLALAAFFVWQKQESSDSCTATTVMSRAEIATKHPVTLLGDVVEMKVEVRFCPEEVTVHRDSLENLDVSPFDLRSRSGITERKDGAFTVWEITYELQALNVIPGAKYAVRSMSLSYEHNQLLKETTFSSNPIFVGSLLSPDIQDIRPVTRERLEEKESLNPLALGALTLGASLLLAAAGALFFIAWRVRNRVRRKEEAREGSDERFEAWWRAIVSRNQLQRMYFAFRELELRGVLNAAFRARVREALEVLEESFNPHGDPSAIKTKIKACARLLFDFAQANANDVLQGEVHDGLDA